MPPTEHELRLRERLGRLRNLPLLGGARISGELERLQRQISRIGEEATDEEIWRKVELARHDDRPYTLDYVERLLDDWFELHGDRALARRRRDDRRPRQARRPYRRARRPAEGTRHPRAREPPLRDAEPRGVPQGVARDGDRRPARLPGHLARGHAGCVSGSRCRAARAGRGDRPLAGGHGTADGADRRLRDRRGRLGRGDRDRACRQGPHAGERDLLRHLAGGLRGDPVARRGPGEEGGGRLSPGRDPLSRARRRRRDRLGAGRRRAHRSGHGGAACSGRRCGESLAELEGIPGDDLRRRRRARFRSLGVFA